MSDDTTPAAGGGRSFGVGALIATGIVAFVIAAVAGYAFGHSKGEDSGQSSGKSAGEAAEQAKYEPGKPAYEAIFDAGRKQGRAEGVKVGLVRGTRAGLRRGAREGKKVGYEEGDKVGISTGQKQGVTQGANAALGGLSEWQVGDLYVVTVEQGDGVPFTVTRRHLMEPDMNYKLCKNDPQEACASAQVTAASE